MSVHQKYSYLINNLLDIGHSFFIVTLVPYQLNVIADKFNCIKMSCAGNFVSVSRGKYFCYKHDRDLNNASYNTGMLKRPLLPI